MVGSNSEITTSCNEVIFPNHRSRYGNIDMIPHIRKSISNKKIAKSTLSGCNFYAGIKYDHYGHFLLESLSRLSNFDDNKHDAIIWFSKNDVFSAWQKEILNILGLGKAKHIVIQKKTFIENLHLWERGYISWDLFENYHGEFLSKVNGIFEPFKNKKCWLSRFGKNAPEEFLIEHFLKLDGWMVINPSDYSVLAQVKLFNSAQTISGISGSAFHSMILSAECINAVKIFNRAPGKINRNYINISKMKEKPHEFIPLGRGESQINACSVLDNLNVPYNSELMRLSREKLLFKASDDNLHKAISLISTASDFFNELGDSETAITLIKIALQKTPNDKAMTKKLHEYLSTDDVNS